MGNPPGRFGEEQALLGNQPREPPLAAVTCERFIITLTVVTEEGEMETILTVSLAVACAGVAAKPRENRHDVFGEIPRAGGNRRKSDSRGGGSAADGRLDRDDALPHWPHIAPRLERNQPGGFRGPMHLGRQVAARILRGLHREELQTGIIRRYGKRLG